MPNNVLPGLAAKAASSPILDRFRDLLRIREEDIRAYSYDAPPPTTDEIVRMYEDVLSDLIINSKPIITDLTIIAGEQREHSEGIANAVRARILEVQAEQKLPALYLLDSIVKNIGGAYVRYFSSWLAEVFCEAYRQVQPTLHGAIRRLFGTWSTVFPSSVLHRIEAELQFSPSIIQQPLHYVMASESPRSAHGIHVNPKYVEDANNVRGASTYKMYEQKPIAEHDDFESGQAVGILSNVAARRSTSNGYGVHTSLHAGGHVRCSSPLIDEYAGSKSSSGIVERASPAHDGFTYGLHMKSVRDAEAFNWRRSHGFENISACNQKQDRTRALIDAYGQDNGQTTMDVNPHNVGLHTMNGFDEKMVTRPWQHTEEEEFDWQDLNPTFVDSKCTGWLTSGNCKTRPGGGIHGTASLSPLRRSWPGSTHVSSIHDFPKLSEDAAAFLDAGHLSVTKHHLDETFQQSDAVNPQGAWNLSERNIPAASGASSSANAPAGLRAAVDIPKLQVTPSPPIYLPHTQTPGNINSAKAPHLAATQPRPIPSHHSIRPPVLFQQQFLPPHASTQSFSQGSMGPTYPVGSGNQLMNHAAAVLHPSLPPAHVSRSTSQAQGVLPPLFPGYFPARPQFMPPISAPSTSSSIQYSGLINSLVAQGVISLTKQTPVENSIGVDFDQDLLKVMRESSVRALYADLPRQCKTCGHRFKTQEEHSKHMDWHVTKNRMSKNRRQNPSRKWYVSSTMWLSSAEALGTDAGPGFLPTDTAKEKQDEEELAVPADENQKTCALCGEPFEDFYSDETDEWMYRGAVYLSAPDDRSTTGMDILHLGPIVHAKCRSDSNTVSCKSFGQEEEVVSEGCPRKRMRT